MKRNELGRKVGSATNAAEFLNAEKITRQSNSNLALAFIALGRERRRDITTFYAFCRLIDDIADDPQLEVAAKQRQLDQWRGAIRDRVTNEPAVADDVRTLMTKYRLAPAMFDEIISGVEMDLYTKRYATFEELRVYCYRVASAVGLVSIEIFGYRNPACREYAIQLGLALQMTNIIRDVGSDLEQGRIYLPQEDIARFDYSETDLMACTYNENFRTLMQFQAARAHECFRCANAALPREDRHSMQAAEIMRAIYQRLLELISMDHFRVFDKRYSVSRGKKIALVVQALLNFT